MILILSLNYLLRKIAGGRAMFMGDFQKNEDFSFSENNLNIK